MNPRDKLVLWLAGSGFDKPHTDEVLANQRVIFELDQDPVDAVGLMWSLPYHARPKDAREQLEFLSCFGG